MVSKNPFLAEVTAAGVAFQFCSNLPGTHILQ
jgi:hypothetical protein